MGAALLNLCWGLKKGGGGVGSQSPGGVGPDFPDRDSKPTNVAFLVVSGKIL